MSLVKGSRFEGKQIVAYSTPVELTSRQMLLTSVDPSVWADEAPRVLTTLNVGQLPAANPTVPFENLDHPDTNVDPIPSIQLPALYVPEYIDLTAANDEDAPLSSPQVKVVMERTENPYLCEAFAACGLETYVAAYSLAPDLAAPLGCMASL